MVTRWFVVTCDVDSWSLARDEIVAATALRSEFEVAPGVWLLEGEHTFDGVAEAWHTRPPIFVRHVHPVHRALGLEGDAGDSPSLAWRLEEDGVVANLLDPGLPFSVQTRVLAEIPSKPFDMNGALAPMLAAASGAPLDVRAPGQVVSLTCVRPLQGFEQSARRAGLFPRGEHTDRAVALALAGVSRVADNLSDWAGGMRRFAREDGQVSRAEFKLLEALDIFGIVLAERGVALDLGASPGGWTRVLRQRGQYVTAVDPGELDPRIAADPGVRHKRMTAEEYLRGEPDRFDVIVNDMRMDARDSARMMVACARCLYPHGLALMTLKLPEAGRRPLLDLAVEIIERAFEIKGARQLFHNRSEVTLYLRPRSEKGK